MALKLRVPVKFMNSDALPAVCLFSGRTDKVGEKSLSIDYVHWIVKTIAVVLLLTGIGWLIAAIVYSLGRHTVSITAPQAPWEKLKWSLVRSLGLPVLIAPVVAGCFIGGAMNGRGNDAFVIGFLIGFLVGVIAGIGVTLWTWRKTTGLRAVDLETVQLTFPDRLAAVHEQYRAAYDTWQQETARRRGSRGPVEDEEDWVDDRVAQWDESKKES